MRVFKLIPCALIALLFGTTLAHGVKAETASDSAAARYIRTLFDATLQGNGALAARCRDVEGLGRFAAGRSWQALTDEERVLFTHDFCGLADEAVTWLHRIFPDLTVAITATDPAPQGMFLVRGTVTDGDASNWPVDWLVAEDRGSLRLADLRISGISLGIFLRGLAVVETPDPAKDSLRPDDILHPWRRALDRARKAWGTATSR